MATPISSQLMATPISSGRIVFSSGAENQGLIGVLGLRCMAGGEGRALVGGGPGLGRCRSRTDRGVHARSGVLGGETRYLPEDVVVVVGCEGGDVFFIPVVGVLLAVVSGDKRRAADVETEPHTSSL